MSFVQKAWADGPTGGTPITAAELNRVEQGITDATDTAVAAQTVAATAVSALPSPVGVAAGYVYTAHGDDTATFSALGSASTHPATDFDAAGAASAVLATSLQKSSNLGDVSSTDAALANLRAAKYVTPEQFNTGTDAGNIQAALSVGASSTDHTVIVLRYGRTYDLSTTTVAWDSATGFLTVLAHGATLSYSGTGSAITELTHTGGNNPPTTKWIGGTYVAASAARFFDCTDVRSCRWDGCKFNTPAGVAIYMTNIASFCERNEIDNCYSSQCQQFFVGERGFKSSSAAVTFASAGNLVTQAGHGFQSGDWVKYATVGTSGLTANILYYINTVPDANTYTLSAAMPDAFGAFAATVTLVNGAGTAYDLAAGSFARLKIRNLSITGGVYGYAQVQYKNNGPYDSEIGPFSGNVSNGVGMMDFLGGRTQGNSEIGPFKVEASDDGKTITGLASTNVITASTAPASRPLALNQAVQLTKVVGGSGVVSEKVYYIKTLPSATTFTLSTTPGGATLSLGTDITGGNFWNVRPWIFRWGQSAGQAPIFRDIPTLRNTALYDPTQLNADGVTPSVPDGSLSVFKYETIHGALIQNSKQYQGIDLLGASAPLTNPYNPTLYVDDGTRDQLGGLVIRPAQGKGIFLLDKTGTVLLGSDHLGVLSGSVLTSTPGALITEAVIDFTSTKTDAATTSTTGSDITADGITAAWTGVVANSLDCTFVAPTSGVVRVEIEALLKISATGSNIRFQISDVTAAPALVANSLMSVFQSATTTNLRARYSRKFTVVAGQTYVWRPQWLVSGAVTGTMSVGAQNGPVRMSVFAWK